MPLRLGRREADGRVHLLQDVERDTLLRRQVGPRHIQMLAPARVVLPVEDVETDEAVTHRLSDRLERDARLDTD
jgi:hypothetical protein